MPKAHALNMETVFVNGHPKPLDKTRLANVVFENMHKAGGYQAGIETAYVEGHPKPLVKTRLTNFVFENLHEAGGAGRRGVYEGGARGDTTRIRTPAAPTSRTPWREKDAGARRQR